MTVGKSKKAGPAPGGGGGGHKERFVSKTVKGENFYRTAKKVKQVNMLRQNAAFRDKNGNITQAAPFQSGDVPTARIAPDRRWFSNSRVISQDTLAAFRAAMAEKAKDPHTFLMRRNKLPMTLLETKEPTAAEAAEKAGRLQDPNFANTFGPRAQRKRSTVGFGSFGELSTKAEEMAEELQIEMDMEREEESDEDDGGREMARDSIFSKGQSHRIWSELHKVIDASDVVYVFGNSSGTLGTCC
jgi:nuclear GTP-binding protein